MKIKVLQVVNYESHSVKKNGNIDLTFSSAYDQMTKSVELLQMLNNNVSIMCKKPNEKSFSLGTFMIKNINFDGDGETKIKFNSMDINVEMNNLNRIITADNFLLRCEADVDVGEDCDG